MSGKPEPWVRKRFTPVMRCPPRIDDGHTAARYSRKLV